MMQLAGGCSLRLLRLALLQHLACIFCYFEPWVCETQGGCLPPSMAFGRCHPVSAGVSQCQPVSAGVKAKNLDDRRCLIVICEHTLFLYALPLFMQLN